MCDNDVVLVTRKIESEPGPRLLSACGGDRVPSSEKNSVMRDQTFRRTPVLSLVAPFIVSIAVLVGVEIYGIHAHLLVANGVVQSALVPFFSGVVIVFLGYWAWRQNRAACEQFSELLAMAQQARARAEEASRARDNLLGTVAHELRNPLNSIMLWCVTLLRDPALSESARRGMMAIERGARAQGQLIEDLLDVLRIEGGRLRLDVQRVDLAEVVHAGVESMRAAADAKSIALQEIIDPRVGPIAGDAGRLKQVVWNLVSNAVKFTPIDGKVQVRLEFIDSHAGIIVVDTGRGIDSASLGSVFDRFWQADGPGQGRQGVGLGLSIVREIVSLHGGAVFAHSEGPGRGSIFTVRLPLSASTIDSAV